MKKEYTFELKEIRDTSRGFVHRFIEVDSEEVFDAGFSLVSEAPSGLLRGQRVRLKLEPLAPQTEG